MKTASDAAPSEIFDPTFAGNLLIEIAQERSVVNLMKKVVDSFLGRPGVARVEIWLIEKGDICSSCEQRPHCPDQTRCLHLAAWRESSLPDGSSAASRSYYSAIRIPLGFGIIGKIASTGGSVELRHVDQDPGELADEEWLRWQQICAFSGTALTFRGEILGVINGFARVNPPEDQGPWRQVVADHIGSAIVNARAFEEIQRLKAQLEVQNAYLQEEVVEAKAFGDLVGQSQELRHIINQIDLVAPTEASVLILGESGTGKELVAREIHRRSRRNHKPLVRVNCASIPKDLFESEFFGHARGAFTGAIKDRTGRFEAAEGGTLFLDEIGEVPLDLQSKLLRVLQDKRFERVGEDRSRLADVRIIAATNRDLKQDVAQGRFREDLYYRLNVFPIEVPPLRERMEDLPLLAKHFIQASARELGCPQPRLTRAGLAKLQNYHWPGNIRELRNVIERAVIISRGGVLDFDLPTGEPALVPLRRIALEASEPGTDYLTEAELLRRERENLLVILQRTNWKIKGADGAAELLGVKPTTLITRINRMGLKRPN